MNKISLLMGLFAVGCSAGQGEIIQEMHWERTNVGTVIRVSWTLEQEAKAWVEFGPIPDCSEWSTPVQTGDSGEVLLLGLPPVTDTCFVLKAKADGVEESTSRETFRTENVPASLEPMVIEQIDPEAYEDGFWVGSNPSNPAFAYVMDREGNYVWWSEGDEESLTPQVILDPNGQGVYFNAFNKDFSVDESEIVLMGFDGVVQWELSTPNGHHSYALLPGDRIAYLAVDVRDTDEYGPVVGDAVMIDDGSGPEVLYSTWDDEHILLEPHDQWNLPFYPQGIDWTHANYLSFNASRNSFTISFANAEAIVEIDADTGAHLRSIGQAGTHSVEEGLLGRPHAAEWTEEGTLMLFTTPKSGKQSMGVELSFDEETLSTEVLWSYGEGLNYYTFIMGAVDRLENGNTLMNFGSKGVIEELSPEGDLVWRAFTATGNFPGHLSFMKRFYEESP
jgi:hypothetical protein